MTRKSPYKTTHSSLTRRSLMQKAAAGGAVVLGASAFPRVGRAAPRKGGTLRIGHSWFSTSDTLDPSTDTGGFAPIGFAALRNNLVEIDGEGNVIPELAEAIVASDGAKRWTFTIRQGVEFHDGKPLTPEDVVGTLNYHRGEDSASAVKNLVAAVTEITIDGNAVVIDLEGANADFDFLMADPHFAILPVVDGKVDADSGNGTGGYILESFEPGIRASATRNPNYWKEGRAHFDSIEMLAIQDDSARLNALVTGQVDLINAPEVRSLQLIERNDALRLIELPSTQHFAYTMSTNVAPFDNLDVRLALKHAIDREALVKTVLGGRGSVGNDIPITPANRYHNPNLPQREYDPDKARFHLRQAGIDDLTIQLSAADAAFAGAVDGAVLYQEHARAAGINIEVVREPNDGYWNNVWMQKPWSAVVWSGRPTEDQMFSTAYQTGAKWNDSFWSNERFDELLIAARAELDDDLRREMYFEMQEILWEDGGVVVPMLGNLVYAMSSKIGTPDALSSAYMYDGYRGVERWWFS